MQTHIASTLFVFASCGLGACATTAPVNHAPVVQTESGDTVQIVHANSVAELTPAPMQCNPSNSRHDLLCNAVPTDHLYASAMGLDRIDNGTNVPTMPRHDLQQCNVAQNTDNGGMCMDNSVASDEDD